jgi:hypothetical protein
MSEIEARSLHPAGRDLPSPAGAAPRAGVEATVARPPAPPDASPGSQAAA